MPPRPAAVRTPTPSGTEGRVAFRRQLLAAADELWRDLPWRATRDPWRVLVSEVMLQQTQAARVVEPYLRFTARFPTPRSCAAAGVAEVVRQWAGLGYNRRAVRLHQAAVAVVERHGGEVPPDLRALLELPGIGAYTARAVLVFAHGAHLGVVDTNAARVLSRAVAGRGVRPAEAQELADDLVAAGGAWRFNQAVFDLGARHCSARSPDCAPCPVRAGCRWAAAGFRAPDPAAGLVRRQGTFAGSDRQGRGRLVAALRRAPVPVADLPHAAGWPGDEPRARRVASAVVADGLARWVGDELVLA